MSDQSELFQAVVAGNPPAAVQSIQQLLKDGFEAKTILTEHLIPAMGEVGRLFDENEYFVPDLLMAAKAMQEAMKKIDPLLKGNASVKKGVVVIGTVSGDNHDIGKNLVATMLEGNGFEVINLGVNVSAEKFVAEVKKREGIVLIGLSALLTTTMPQMKKVIDLFVAEGLRDRTKVMIGGAPVTEDYANQIGADGYSDSAYSAVQLALSFAS